MAFCSNRLHLGERSSPSVLLDDRAAAMMHVYKEQLAVGLDGIQIFIPSDRPFKISRFAGISLKKRKKNVGSVLRME